jgi:hypothetical protein
MTVGQGGVTKHQEDTDDGPNEKVGKTPETKMESAGDGDRDCEYSSEVKELQKIKQPVNSAGIPIHVFNVPGVSRKPGTPSWVSGPAKAATGKAK